MEDGIAGGSTCTNYYGTIFSMLLTVNPSIPSASPCTAAVIIGKMCSYYQRSSYSVQPVQDGFPEAGVVGLGRLWQAVHCQQGFWRVEGACAMVTRPVATCMLLPLLEKSRKVSRQFLGNRTSSLFQKVLHEGPIYLENFL